MSMAINENENPVIKQKLIDVEAIIWDLDNTLYKIDNVLIDAFHLSYARAAIAAGADLKFGEAAKMARKSFEETGFSGQIFVEKYGIERADMHFEHHGYMDETVIEKSLEMRSLFLQLSLEHALLTHSARNWAEKVLDHLTLREWFPKNRIFALEDCDFFPKQLACKYWGLLT